MNRNGTWPPHEQKGYLRALSRFLKSNITAPKSIRDFESPIKASARVDKALKALDEVQNFEGPSKFRLDLTSISLNRSYDSYDRLSAIHNLFDVNAGMLVTIAITFSITIPTTAIIVVVVNPLLL